MIYFDESGYTGPDLNNVKQPYFALASIRMDDEEIARVKNDIDFEKWGRELHFTSMYTNRPGQIMLDMIFHHPLMDSDHVLLSFAHKRYCIYANIVDILVETMYYNNDVSLYEGAKNLILANGLYYYSCWHPNRELISEFERSFVKMVRAPSVGNIGDFYRTTERLRDDADTNKEFKDLLSEIPPTIQYIEKALPSEGFYLDLTIPLFSVSIQEWYNKTGVKESVLFDSSEPFFANKQFLEQLRDMNVPETKVGYGANKHVYPLPLGRMDIEKSHKAFGIQLADIFASSLVFALTPRSDKYVVYQEKVKQLPIFQNIKLNIAPSSIDFIDERTKETAEIDPLEFLCKHGSNM